MKKLIPCREFYTRASPFSKLMFGQRSGGRQENFVRVQWPGELGIIQFGKNRKERLFRKRTGRGARGEAKKPTALGECIFQSVSLPRAAPETAIKGKWRRRRFLDKSCSVWRVIKLALKADSRIGRTREFAASSE